MVAPISMLIDGCYLYNPLQFFGNPKLYFIEREVNSIIGKIYTVLKWRHLKELFKGSALGFPYAVNRRPTASQMHINDYYTPEIRCSLRNLSRVTKWRRQSESMVNRTRINSAQSIFFLDISRRQAISVVAKCHHVLWHGFMIQRVILIFIKCLLANQNQLFYMKV